MKDPHSERERPEPADSNWRHPMYEIDPVEPEGSFSLIEVEEALYFVLSELKKSSCAPMLLDCMCLSVGLLVYYKENGSDLARKYGVSRQRINTVKQQCQDKLGVVGDAFAKKEGAKDGYKLTNKRNTACLTN